MPERREVGPYPGKTTRVGLELGGPYFQCMDLMLQRSITVVAMVVLPLTCAQPAWGQGPTSETLPTDTTLVQNYQFKPLFTATSKASVTSVSLGGEFRHTFEMLNGLRLMTTLGSKKEDFRLQDRSNESKRFSNTLFHRIGRGWTLDMSHMENRTFNRVVSFQGGFQDVILNTLTLGAGLRHITLAPDNFRWDARLNGALADAEKTDKTDTSLGGDVAVGIGYNLFHNWLVVRGRGYFKNIDVVSQSALARFDDLFLREDSLSADVEVHFSDHQVVKFEYDTFNAEERFTDQRRGSLGGQFTGAENLFAERRVTEARVMNLGFTSLMLNGLDLQVNAQHSESVTDYDSTKTRFGRNVTNFLKSNIGYKLFTGTDFTAKLDVTQGLRDLGPQSVSSYDRRGREVNLGLSHQFASGFSFNVNAGIVLTQTFYLRYKENPRDIDQLDRHFNASVTSRTFKKVQANLSAAFTQTDFINIDKTLSSNNRVQTRYDFRPMLTYQLNPRITIAQTYRLGIEFTDHTFLPEDNYLDRNISFSNEVRADVTTNLRGSFYYGYFFHDRGSYVPIEEGGERYLDVAREDRRDETRIQFTYKINAHISAIGKHGYSRKEDRTIGRDNVRVTENGIIEFGFRGNYNWTADRTFQFTLVKANQYGAFTSLRQKDYWIVDAQFKYGF